MKEKRNKKKKRNKKTKTKKKTKWDGSYSKSVRAR